MKYIILLLPLILAFGCGEVSQQLEEKNLSDLEKTQSLSDLNAIPYPMGSPSKEVENFMRWGQIEDEDEQLLARNESRALMNEAFKIAYTELGIRPGKDMNDENIAEIIERSKSVFQNHVDNPALFLAEQMMGMKIQEAIFPDFVNQNDISVYKENTLTPQEIDALSLTTELFVKNKNPNADLISLNLHHLKGSLETETIAEFAEKTKSNAKNWFLESEICDECPAKNEAKILSIRTYIEELSRM